MRLEVDGAFSPPEVRDALLVVASFNVARHSGRELLSGIRALDRRRVPLGGIEGGTWVLALAGVLDGHAATTHWEDLDEFSARFPLVRTSPDRFVVDGRFLTSGGAAPTLDLMLRLVRDRQGLPLSLEVASSFVYDRPDGGPAVATRLPLGLLGEQDQRLVRCLRLMTDRIEAPLALKDLARSVEASTRTLETLFKRAFGQTPGAFYLSLRLAAALRLVLDTRRPMTEIAMATGFDSASAFARAFRSRYGAAPRALRTARRGRG